VGCARAALTTLLRQPELQVLWLCTIICVTILVGILDWAVTLSAGFGDLVNVRDWNAFHGC
jgi:hypothetical protein